MTKSSCSALADCRNMYSRTNVPFGCGNCPWISSAQGEPQEQQPPASDPRTAAATAAQARRVCRERSEAGVILTPSLGAWGRPGTTRPAVPHYLSAAPGHGAG